MTSPTPLLDTVDDPADIRRLARGELQQLATELRTFVLESVSATGGHLSSNLGTVELTIALHYVFDTPHDRIVWDVGHQTYGHKILTGRREDMKKLRIRSDRLKTVGRMAAPHWYCRSTDQFEMKRPA